MCREFLVLAAAASLFACVPDGTSPLPSAVGDDDDGTEVEEPLPELEEYQVEIRSPELVLPPGEEIIYCYFGTWEGGDVAINKMDVFQHPMTHHLLIKSVPEDDPTPDGTLMDCTQPTDQMSSYSVFLEGYIPPGEELSTTEYEGGLFLRKWLDLPDGMGVPLAAGTRYVIDAHYVNVSDEELTTEAVFRIHTIEQDDVTDWVGSFNHHAGVLQLEPGLVSRENTCAWEVDTSILTLGAHMHNYGAAYSVDWHKPDGTVTRLLDLDEWSLDFWTHPVTARFLPGEVEVEAGDWFTTTCSWNNTTDEMLDYPDEMCTTFGVAVPLAQSFECFGGEINLHD